MSEENTPAHLMSAAHSWPRPEDPVDRPRMPATGIMQDLPKRTLGRTGLDVTALALAR